LDPVVVPESLLRGSVGVEDVVDLGADLAVALHGTASGERTG
jgi:cystathionine beta-lyase/cystathionine gamma-synthase